MSNGARTGSIDQNVGNDAPRRVKEGRVAIAPAVERFPERVAEFEDHLEHGAALEPGERLALRVERRREAARLRALAAAA